MSINDGNGMVNIIEGLLGDLKAYDYESMSQSELLKMIADIDKYLNDKSNIINDLVLLEAKNMKNEIRKFIK